jgi:hypothetical protein
VVKDPRRTHRQRPGRQTTPAPAPQPAPGFC